MHLKSNNKHKNNIKCKKGVIARVKKNMAHRRTIACIEE
jgi:hypothetical protein